MTKRGCSAGEMPSKRCSDLRYEYLQLAINSEYCTSIVKGNLHLANWKRKQGCRCAMLKKLVDWCGCSPLIFSARDTAKFALEVSKDLQISARELSC